MQQDLDGLINEYVSNAQGEVDLRKLMTLLIDSGQLTQERMDRIILIGPLDEWLEMKIRRAQHNLRKRPD